MNVNANVNVKVNVNENENVNVNYMNRELIEREIKMLGSVQEGFDNSATNQHTKVADRIDHKKLFF